MEHGRDHDERRQRAEPPRNQNTPKIDWDDEVEHMMDASGRGDARPPAGLVGPHYRRTEPSVAEEGATDLPPADGSEYAPTAQATRRERERHRLERERGRVAGGTAGFVRDTRAPEVTRDALKDAAREADRRIAGRPLRGAGGDEPAKR